MQFEKNIIGANMVTLYVESISTYALIKLNSSLLCHIALKHKSLETSLLPASFCQSALVTIPLG